MPTNSLTKYCCLRVASNRHVTLDTPPNCSNTYTVLKLGTTLGSTFGSWNNSTATQRTCLSVVSCGGDGVTIRFDSGCFPKSVFPVTINYEVFENGNSHTIGQETYTSAPIDTSTCPDGTCPEVCS